MLSFDESTAKILETAYIGGDFVGRRRASLDALAPNPGETIIDLGCGNGLMTEELSLAVGPDGRVIGVDPSDDMLVAARKRLGQIPQAALIKGLADDLPIDTGSVDKVVSVQVFEYIEDLAAAAREVARVLRPGGKAVVSDMHFGTWAWHSDHPDRMSRMMASWNEHVAHLDTPAILPAHLTMAGLRIEAVKPHAMMDTVLRPDGMPRMLMLLMERYAVSNAHLSPEEARAWAEEQTALAAEGRFFHSVTHVVIVARKPG